MTNIAIENGPVEIVDFPMKNGGSFHSYVGPFFKAILGQYISGSAQTSLPVELRCSPLRASAQIQQGIYRVLQSAVHQVPICGGFVVNT